MALFGQMGKLILIAFDRTLVERVGRYYGCNIPSSNHNLERQGSIPKGLRLCQSSPGRGGGGGGEAALHQEYMALCCSSINTLI